MARRAWLSVEIAVGVVLATASVAVVVLAASGMGQPSINWIVGGAALAARLGALEGLTGLDPLDPSQPLTRADVLSVETTTSGDRARIRFSYADGTSREYSIWLSHPRLLGGWRYTGIDRVFAPHEELPALPFAGPDGPLALGPPARLSVADSLLQSSGYCGQWFNTAFLTSRSTWSPKGDAVLIGLAPSSGDGCALWLVPTDGRAPSRLAENVVAAQWTPDGTFVVYLRWLSDPRFDTSLLILADREGRVIWTQPFPSRSELPFMTASDRVLWMQDGALWGLRYNRDPAASPERLRDLPDSRVRSWDYRPLSPIAPSPDSARIAYVCDADVCLADLHGDKVQRIVLPPLGPAAPVGVVPTPVQSPITVPATVPPVSLASAPGAPGPKPTPPLPPASQLPHVRIAWSPDGRRIAVARSDAYVYGCSDAWCDGHQPRLSLVDDHGRLLLDVPVGPNGFVDTPRWTPDGEFIFLPAYPQDGRRIVAVESASGRVYDLSQPRWDAFFSLSPDGTRLLVTNARGGLWLAPLVRS